MIIAPCDEQRMDDDMRCIQGVADIQRLIHPLAHDRAHLGVIACQRPAPERPVNAQAAHVPVQQA